jgi:peptidoglycan hydrolase-like protein with peptidoglycan-binding domain
MEAGRMCPAFPKGAIVMNVSAPRPRGRRRAVTGLAVLATGAAGFALPMPAAQAAAAQAAAAPASVTVAPASVSLTAVTTAAQPKLTKGARGAAVKRLQQRLSDLHYDTGSIDGVFGDDTVHGVYAFQKVQGLGVDGVVGPATWAKLSKPRVPTVKHKLSAAAVEVSLSRRVVYLTKNGKVTKIIDASPGKASTPTVRGNFSFTRRIDGWRNAPLGLLWRPYYFHGGYAIHGSRSVPTYAASHGCVRLTMASMNRLWGTFKIGEKVYVYK